MRAMRGAHEVLIKNGNQRKCNFCHAPKTWEFSHFRIIREVSRTFERKIFMDEFGRCWDGVRCPDCLNKKDREYAKKRKEKVPT